jgi:hypothetical protein
MYIASLVPSLSYSEKEHNMADKVQEPSNPE